MTASTEIWIKTGYELFALHGMSGVVIETIAKRVKVSKSSFYHHFVDMQLFIEKLLEYHICQSYVIGEKEKAAEKINPDLIDILYEHKIDLLFNRQLRINKSNRLYATVLDKSTYIVGNHFVNLWIKDLDLKLSKKQLEGIFELSLDNFYLQLTPENLSKEWLVSYFENLKRIISYFQ